MSWLLAFRVSASKCQAFAVTVGSPAPFAVMLVGLAGWTTLSFPAPAALLIWIPRSLLPALARKSNKSSRSVTLDVLNQNSTVKGPVPMAFNAPIAVAFVIFIGILALTGVLRLGLWIAVPSCELAVVCDNASP